MLDNILQEYRQPVRLLGGGMMNLSMGAAIQQTMFDTEEKEKLARIDETCDELKQKFGHGVVRSASAIERGVGLNRHATNEDRKPD